MIKGNEGATGNDSHTSHHEYTIDYTFSARAPKETCSQMHLKSYIHDNFVKAKLVYKH